MVRLVVVLALLTGCKSMGHVASGLGHIASATGHVARGFGHVASAVGHVAAPAARVAARALPVVENAVEIAAMSQASYAPPDPYEAPDDPPPAYVSQDGPLLDNHDPCNACPEDVACDQCAGAGGAACRLTPPGAFTRCESGLPR